MKFLEKIVGETNNKKKIENMVFLIIVLIITLVAMNNIWNGKKEDTNRENENSAYDKVLASSNYNEIEVSQVDFAKNIENILSTIKGVGEAKVLLNYSESGSVVPIYDETTTTSSTEEQDTSGGTRNVTQTQSQKDVVFCESSGTKEPVTQKTLMPIIRGAIVTAKGAENATIKTNIISAIQTLTGLTADKIQVFEME